METQTKIQWGVIGILAMIVTAIGGTVYLTPEQLDNAYICSINENVVIADHLSSTAKTAYWMEGNEEKSQVCRGGEWIKLKKYATDNNIDINVLLKNLNGQSSGPTQPATGIQYTCPPSSQAQTCHIK